MQFTASLCTLWFFCFYVNCAHCNDDKALLDDFMSVVLHDNGEDVVGSSAGGVFTYRYPEIEAAVKKLASREQMSMLAIRMMRFDYSSERKRRRIYFAIRSLAANIHSQNSDHKLPFYVLGYLDERARQEERGSAKLEAINASLFLGQHMEFEARAPGEPSLAPYALVDASAKK